MGASKRDWYVHYRMSYRDLEELRAERGIEVDPVSGNDSANPVIPRRKSAVACPPLSQWGTRSGSSLSMTVAEDRGFEPLRAFTQPAFQASAIGH